MVARSPRFENTFGFILADISRLARKEFDRRMRELGLTRAQWLFLVHLARRPGCSQSDLAESLQVQKISVSRQAARLLRSGWIQRRDCPDDGRAYHLFVAPKAEPLIEKLAEVGEELRDEYMRGLPGPRRDALISDLLHIKSNLLRMEGRFKRRSHDQN